MPPLPVKPDGLTGSGVAGHSPVWVAVGSTARVA
jgi:hypothetical protein